MRERTVRRWVQRLMVVGLAVLVCGRGQAQTADGGPDPARARVRIGPLWASPTLSLADVGIDTNVLNAPDGSQQRDFTMTVTPATDLWLRMGPTWLTGTVREDVVWFQKLTAERFYGTNYKLGWNAPLNHLIVNTAATWLDTRERPGYEIDARTQRHEQTYAGAVDFRFLSRTSVGVKADLRTVRFNETATFLNMNLHDELNHTSTTVGVAVKHQLTPLTALSFNATRAVDRFDFNPLRNAESRTYTGLVTFDPAALIKGTASFGYRDFRPSTSSLGGYRGTVAAAELSYTLLGSTRFTFEALRDVQFSYDVNQPYYLQTGLTGSVAQQVYGPVDVTAKIGHQNLDYGSGLGTSAINRTDSVQLYGGGLGYHLSPDVRLGFDVQQIERTSVVSTRQYKGLRYGMSLKYGY